MLSNLAWLPEPGADYRERLKALRRADLANASPADIAELRALATAALGEPQLANLAKLVAGLRAAGRAVNGFDSLCVGLVGDATLNLLAPAIAGSGVRHGLLMEVVPGGYNMVVQEALDPSSAIRARELDMLVIATDARILGLGAMAATPEAAAATVDAALARIAMLLDNFAGSVKSTLFVQTVVPPIELLFGSLDSGVALTPLAMCNRFNAALNELAAERGFAVIDVAGLAGSVGLERWHHPGHWNASKLSFAPEMIPVYADVVARTIAAARGRSRKCLVLDLDNTVWGGIIGDDGLEGIAIGQGSAAGEAHVALQRMALDLRSRGVVLAVCSKNEDVAARLPFREHPEMLLRENHIAVFQANWTDKASNLRAIAEALNIGIDALVFLDDNPAERAQVRKELPMVAVPEVPDDPAYFARTLAAAGYFEAIAFSSEDRARATYYQDNASRAAMQASTSDMASYLASLEMICRIAPVDAVSRDRVSQLINKSNQFNLTTRRYSLAEVAAVEGDPALCHLQIRLEDRFGDNGIISVVFVRKARHEWEIDTWLMSCRVLGRRVEEAALGYIAAAARAAGAHALIGRYVPSAKNMMVADHYRKLGFSLVDTRPEGETVWSLDVCGYEPPSLPMQIDAVPPTSRS